MVKSMYAAVAGLNAHQSKMDVIGNNIANVNTWGYKAKSTSFKESMYQTLSGGSAGSQADGGYGATNPSVLGYGSMVSAIAADFTSGSPAPSTGELDCFIDGTAFFAVGPKYGDNEAKLPEDITLSRVGDFGVRGGYLVDSNGRFVYGSSVTTGGEVRKEPDKVVKTEEQLDIPIPDPNPDLSGWDAATGTGTQILYAPTAGQSKMTKETTTVAEKVVDLADYGNTFQDEPGVKRYTDNGNGTVKYETSADGGVTWTEDATSPLDIDKPVDSAVDANPRITYEWKAGVTPGDPSVLVTTTVGTESVARKVPANNESTDPTTGVRTSKSYKDNGDGTMKVTTLTTTPAGSENSVGPDFDDGRMTFDPATGGYTLADGMDTLRPLKVPTECTYFDEFGNQQTEENPEFTTFSVDSNGFLWGTSKATNKTYLLGCVTLVSVPNPGGMTKLDGPYYQLGGSSGEAGLVQTGTKAGTLLPGYLEMANVNIATEFSSMITTQRGFQANSKIITVTDEMLQELVNMKR